MQKIECIYCKNKIPDDTTQIVIIEDNVFCSKECANTAIQAYQSYLNNKGIASQIEITTNNLI